VSQKHFANWEIRYNYELAHNMQVSIDNDISIDRRSINSVEHGIYTKELGELPDTDKDIREFSCDCGALYGRFYEGETCPDCETIVKERYGVDIRRVGWIDVSPYVIINPNAYEFLVKVIGNKNLQSIINYDIQINLDGFPMQSIITSKSVSPYSNIGISGLQKRFEEIVTYYANLRGHVADAAILLAEKDCIFSSKIPVSSIYLRPTYISTKKRSVSFDKINSYYMKILSSAILLHKSISNKNRSGAYGTIYSIQQSLQELYDFVIRSKLSGKTKLLRYQVLGTRMNWSSRMVITSLNGRYSGMDNIVMSYKGFLQLYFLEILNCMRRGYGNPLFKNMTVYELLEYLTKVQYSDEVDETIYSIMEMFIEKRGDTLRVLINRNPTLDFGSIQCMKIVHITKDAKNLTAAIPLTSLASLSADYDGDVLNFYSLKEKSVMEAFNTGFNPKNLVIDRTGDKFYNSSFGLIKDQLTNIIELVRPFSDYQ
jgi:hypothetical protein